MTASSSEEYVTGTGQVLHVHTKDNCIDDNCCIHSPSSHHMRDWPTNWRSDRQLMERICEHGVGHPDPDHISFIKKRPRFGEQMASTDSIHGCDGCCSKERVHEG